MAIKVVILFQASTGSTPVSGGFGIVSGMPSAPILGYTGRQHLAGWSEALWWNSDSVTDLLASLQGPFGGFPGLLPTRAALLPNTANIIGVRLYAGGAGKGVSRSYNYAGNPINTTDVPQMALLVKGGPLAFAVSRRFTIRCIPDIFVVQGEFAPSTDYTNAVAQYFYALNNYWFLGRNPPTPANSCGVANITAGGLVTTTVAAQPFAVGNMVTISRALSPAQNFVTFKGLISAVGPVGSQFTMAVPAGGPWTGGTAAIKTTGLYNLSSNVTSVSRTVVRKVGRPFELYRGRRSKRRRSP